MKGELKQASAAWQDLTQTMRAKRAGVKARRKPAPVETGEEKGIVAEEVAPDLEAKLLAAIAERPNGITLTEIAESLGVVPIVLGRASKSLLDKGKVRKEDKSYFPVTSE